MATKKEKAKYNTQLKLAAKTFFDLVDGAASGNKWDAKTFKQWDYLQQKALYAINLALRQAQGANEL